MVSKVKRNNPTFNFKGQLWQFLISVQVVAETDNFVDERPLTPINDKG